MHDASDLSDASSSPLCSGSPGPLPPPACAPVGSRTPPCPPAGGWPARAQSPTSPPPWTACPSAAGQEAGSLAATMGQARPGRQRGPRQKTESEKSRQLSSEPPSERAEHAWRWPRRRRLHARRACLRLRSWRSCRRDITLPERRARPRRALARGQRARRGTEQQQAAAHTDRALDCPAVCGRVTGQVGIMQHAALLSALPGTPAHPRRRA
jgi:hypothetical protein